MEVEGWFFEPSDTTPAVVALMSLWLLYRRKDRLTRLSWVPGSPWLTLPCFAASLGVFNAWDRLDQATRDGATALLGWNLALLALTASAGYLLDRFRLLYASAGTVWGPGFVDARLLMPSLWLMAAVALAVAVAAVIAVRRRRIRPMGWAVAGAVGPLGDDDVATVVVRLGLEHRLLVEERHQVAEHRHSGHATAARLSAATTGGAARPRRCTRAGRTRAGRTRAGRTRARIRAFERGLSAAPDEAQRETEEEGNG